MISKAIPETLLPLARGKQFSNISASSFFPISPLGHAFLNLLSRLNSSFSWNLEKFLHQDMSSGMRYFPVFVLPPPGLQLPPGTAFPPPPRECQMSLRSLSMEGMSRPSDLILDMMASQSGGTQSFLPMPPPRIWALVKANWALFQDFLGT